VGRWWNPRLQINTSFCRNMNIHCASCILRNLAIDLHIDIHRNVTIYNNLDCCMNLNIIHWKLLLLERWNSRGGWSILFFDIINWVLMEVTWTSCICSCYNGLVGFNTHICAMDCRLKHVLAMCVCPVILPIGRF
jgi:hypothetical protein